VNLGAKKAAGPSPKSLTPVFNIAPLGELNAYVVYEHELDQIAEGSPAGLALDVAIALLSSGAGFLLTLTTTTIALPWLFSVYLFVCVNFLLVGVILLGYWWRARTSVRALVVKIKSRKPPPVGIQEQPPTALSSGAEPTAE
jgi:hypothetical protein